MIKTICLVVFRLAQSWNKLFMLLGLGLIDRSLGSINRKSGQNAFSAEFQLSPSFVLKCLGFSNLP